MARLYEGSTRSNPICNLVVVGLAVEMCSGMKVDTLLADGRKKAFVLSAIVERRRITGRIILLNDRSFENSTAVKIEDLRYSRES
mmetsp:Transcript_5968/g.8862  ORF Transcript_5968/g.8862 Transcript_5968/m.8862 type:complete len:85 (+) Transcript_5968:467-721(+)